MLKPIDQMLNQSLLNCVPYVLTCQCVVRAFVLMCQRALRAYVLTCQLVLYAYVLKHQRVLRAYLFTCQLALLTLVPMFIMCLSAKLFCVPTCFRALTSNGKHKFSMSCLPYIWNKTLYEKCSSMNVSRNTYYKNSVVHSCISLIWRKPLTGATTNFLQ